MVTRGTRLIGLAAGLAATFASSIPAGSASAGGVDSPAHRYPGVLFDVAAIPGGDVWAVGYGSLHGHNAALVDRLDGQQWVRVPAPDPSPHKLSELHAVSGVSADDVWAVGDFTYKDARAFIVHWDGTSWSRVPSPAPGGRAGVSVLHDVSAVSANDVWALGDYAPCSTCSQTLPFIEHWNGTVWSLIPSWHFAGSSDTQVRSISADGPDDAWAVGVYDVGSGARTLAEHWDGTKWSKVTSPNPHPLQDNVLAGVRVTSPSDGWAVGYATTKVGGVTALTAHFDGTKWTRVVAPSPHGSGGLAGIAQIGASDVWAVGSYSRGTGARSHPLAERWDGTHWSEVACPNPDGDGAGGFFQGVAATTSDSAWAVGTYGSPQQSLIEHWDGTRWRRMPAPGN